MASVLWWSCIPRRAAIALGCDPSEVADTMAKVLDPSNGVATVEVDRASWHDNTLSGKDIDLAKLPILTHSRGDSGPFITGAVTIAKDPISGAEISVTTVCRNLGKTFLGSM